ncbi:MAG: arsenite efflux transporter metallochaperone ArsD [Clostridiaceae bacterium]|nr:arsenite efflux transporter metallochaperone ArsD [Clostridiaceae bacterium]
MKKMIIFDPAMCCSTGVCGPAVNPDLLRVSTVINRLKNKGIIIERYNLTNNPQAFVDNTIINGLLNSDGVEILPVTILAGEVVKTKQYPTNAEFSKLLEIPEEYLKTKIQIKTKDCGCKGGCC